MSSPSRRGLQGLTLATIVGAAILVGMVGCGTLLQSDPAPDAADGAPDASSDLDAAGATDAVPDNRFVDPCEATRPKQCPAPLSPPAADAGAAGPLRVIDRCAYALNESAGIGETTPLLAALSKDRMPITALLADVNRDGDEASSLPGAPAGVVHAFDWNSDDDPSNTWFPRGITGSADGDTSGLSAGKRIVAVAWSDQGGTLGKGTRVSFADLRTGDAGGATFIYRHTLLVVPAGTAEKPTWTPVETAGHIAWYGRYLYAADPAVGIRVFDLSRVLKPSVDDVAVVGCMSGVCYAGGYKYALLQVGVYAIDESACGMRISTLSVDTSTTPPTLVTGENCGSGSACLSHPTAGRVLHWPLDPKTGLLRSAHVFPTEAYVADRENVRGVTANAGVHYLSTTGGPTSTLHVVSSKGSNAYPWIAAAEGLMFDARNDVLFGTSSPPGERYVFSVYRKSYVAP